jgi:hypothetical protein
VEVESSATIYNNETDKSESVSDGNFAQTAFNVYPNPAFDKIIIDINEDEMSSGIIQLVDMKGETVFNGIPSELNCSGKIILPLGNFPRGVYLILLMNGSNIFSQRIIVN